MNRGTKGAFVVANLKGKSGDPTEFVIENSVARTDTSAKTLGILPASAVVTSVQIWAPVLSDAGTTATVSVGKSGTNNFFVNAFDVKGGTLKAQNFPVASNLHAAVSSSVDTILVGIYAETGGASSTGGPFNVRITYRIP